MHRFIARENVDHYLGILHADIVLSPEKQESVVKLLIAELDKLGQDPEQLEFAETRAAKGRERLKQVRLLRNKVDPAIRDNVERLVASVEATQQLLDDFCHRLRAKVTSPPD